jgi:hypothetical protein
MKENRSESSQGGCGSEGLREVRGGEVEQMLLGGLEIRELERAEAGDVQCEVVFARLGGVEEAAGGDGVEGGE